MKKKHNEEKIAPHIITKIVRVMRITILLITLGIMNVMASNSYSQKAKISLNITDASLETVLDEIENQSEFYFLFNQKLIDANRKVRLNAKNQKIEKVLEKLFDGTNVNYVVFDRQIVLTTSDPTAVPRELDSNASGRNSVLKKSGLQLQGKLNDDKVITGTVTSVEETDGLPGVNVLLKGTSIGTITDINGRFSLNVPDENSILVFSSVGFIKQEIIVGNRATIDISLKADITALKEVVVVGYGTVEKKDLTGAVVSLDKEDMTMGASVSSAAQMLQGRAAGVEVSRGDSKPGGELSVVIRGYNSISNSNEPLYVVDGFPMSAGVSINPSDIESIDILKDASASAIYGSRGSSGVVLITTKKGKRGEVRVSYDGYAGVQKINNTVEFLNWNDYSTNRNQLYADDNNDGNPWYNAADLAIGNDTDWLKEGTRNAGIQSHTVGATGGDETTRFSLSLNSFRQEGILLNTDFNRTSIRLNVDRKFGKNANVGMNIYTAKIDALGASNRPGFRSNSDMYRLLRAEPGRAAYNDDGTLGTTAFSREQGGPPWVNPIGRLTVPDRDQNQFRTYANIWADYKILDGLIAKISVGFDNTANTNSTFEPAIYSAGGSEAYGAISESKNENYIVEGTVSYTPEMSEGHTLNVLAGASDQKFGYRSFDASGNGFPTDKTSYNNLASASVQNIASWRSENRIISFFGRANYSFQDKYLLTATLRADGASQMGANNKWGTFPSASVAWRISEEDFLNASNLIDNLKLRVAYGVTGNNSFSAYTALARVSPTEKQYSFDGSSSVSGLGPDGRFAPNPDLKWETSNMLNIGLDFGLWGSRLFGAVEAYKTQTVDMIIDKSLSSASTGYSVIRANIGEMSNSGIELSLGGNIIDGDFKWTASGNFSKNQNEIVKLDRDAPIVIKLAREPVSGYGQEAYREMVSGGQMGDFFGYTYAGVVQVGETYGPQPLSKPGEAKYMDVNGDGVLDADDRSVIGNATPDFTWGLNNRFAYKGFTLNVFFQGVQGNDLLNLRGVMIDELRSAKAADRYTSANTSGTRPGIGYFDGRNGYGGYVNSEFIEDASYVRLKNVSLSYRFDTNAVSWLGNAEVYVQAENLMTFTNYSGFDPEVSFNYSGVSQSSGRGVDDNGFPNYKTYTIGLRLGF
ncbi:TonB-dependent receptor [Reichenbachiella sp. MALMAid0571]|uniref:TonB-dependent receptor n=1 Tax=Reichenbachiella sp. MALMAid0571 TaxID=3143939 RepID=UPI0032DF5043